MRLMMMCKGFVCLGFARFVTVITATQDKRIYLMGLSHLTPSFPAGNNW
jgi:hypothetical protein